MIEEYRELDKTVVFDISWEDATNTDYLEIPDNFKLSITEEDLVTVLNNLETIFIQKYRGMGACL